MMFKFLIEKLTNIENFNPNKTCLSPKTYFIFKVLFFLEFIIISIPGAI